MQTINQKNIDVRKMQTMQTKLLWKKYSSAIILLGVIIIYCALIINKLASLGVIKMPGSPDDRAKSANIFSIDDAVLTGVLFSLVIAFIICFSLYIKQTYEIKNFRSENALINFVQDYSELEKIKSFLSETAELRNSLIAISIFKQIVSECSGVEEVQTEDDEDKRFQIMQHNILLLSRKIYGFYEKVTLSKKKDYKQLLFILEKLEVLLEQYTKKDKNEVDDYSSYIDKMSFSNIYKLLNEKSDKKDHVKILNAVYRYVKIGNDSLGKEKHTRDTVFFKTKKTDDLYHVFQAISENMILQENRTLQNEATNDTKVINRHLADVSNFRSRKDDNIYDNFILLISENLTRDNYDELDNYFEDLTKKLNDELKVLTKKAPEDKTFEDIEYITERFNPKISNQLSNIVTIILNRNENKSEIEDLYNTIENRKTTASRVCENSHDMKIALQHETKRLRHETKRLTMSRAALLINNEIQFAKEYNSTFDLHNRSAIFSILQNELSKQLEIKLEDMFHDREPDTSEAQRTFNQIDVETSSTEEFFISFDSEDVNSEIKDISSTTSPRRR